VVGRVTISRLFLGGEPSWPELFLMNEVQTELKSTRLALFATFISLSSKKLFNQSIVLIDSCQSFNL